MNYQREWRDYRIHVRDVLIKFPSSGIYLFTGRKINPQSTDLGAHYQKTINTETLFFISWGMKPKNSICPTSGEKLD